ncbi:MAG: metal ABC transporter permease [Alphaproteobacteria bacterium]|nr:metal ABC transporter permease [Alphaproteobacteria bacterium]
MLDDFIINALLAGVGIAVICGVMGCFVVWRRMAYFGDSLAHSALLGIAIGIATGIEMSLSIFLISMGFALLLLWLQHRGVLATDTLLGILAHGALSCGMVLLSLNGTSVDLHGFLFGDILTVTTMDLMLIGLGSVVVLDSLIRNWDRLILMTVSADLAKAEGVKTMRLQLIFLVLMTITVAVSVRMVGVLLITSMLIIPAATSRQLVRSPAAMAIGAVVIGMIATAGGMFMSIELNTPTGPTMVVALTVMFALVMAAAGLRHKLSRG